MHDPWTDRLSEYIDGELAATEARALEAHLATCDECSSTLAELRSIVAAAASLEDVPPATELWGGIAAGIEARRAADAAGSVLPLHAHRRQHPVRRGYSFSVPQRAAAAMLLMSLSAGATWWLAVRQDGPETSVGTIVHTAGDPASSSRLASREEQPAPPTDEPVMERIAELERTLEGARQRLDPATAEIIERSLESIDQAIATAQAAVDADPGNPHLSRQLDNTMRKKLDILRRAHRVQRAGT
jgi:negative regulator of sigma E activity